MENYFAKIKDSHTVKVLGTVDKRCCCRHRVRRELIGEVLAGFGGEFGRDPVHWTRYGCGSCRGCKVDGWYGYEYCAHSVDGRVVIGRSLRYVAEAPLRGASDAIVKDCIRRGGTEAARACQVGGVAGQEAHPLCTAGGRDVLGH